MHQNRFPKGLSSRPCYGSLQRSSRPPIAGFKGPTCKGREKEKKGRRRKGSGRKGRGGVPPCVGNG